VSSTSALVNRFYRANSAHAAVLTAALAPLTLHAVSPLTSLSIAEIARGQRAGKFTALQVTEAHLKNISRLQPQLNAFSHIDDFRAIAQAQEADAILRSNRHIGALHGVPVTIKSCIDVAQWPCPAGSRLRATYVPRHDATMVARLRSAGAILLGNTNAPENLMHYETDNALQGRTANPYNLAHSAGGSSGGEAAAVAARCSTAGIGSDGGGSVRVPAHFCGIVGLKPTPGRIPLTGYFPPTAGAFPWLGVVGPMARTVADVRAMFEVLRGPDPADPLSAAIAPITPDAASLKDLRVGVLNTEAFGPHTPETAAAIETAATALTSCAFAVEQFSLPELSAALDLWWFFFGPTVAHLFRSAIAPNQESQLSPQFREYLTAAAASPAPTLDALLESCTARDHLRARILSKMSSVPILLAPVCQAPAFRHGEGTWCGRNGFRQTMRASQWLNLVGFPAIAVPMYLSAEGLPIGVQLIGRPNEDELLLQAAAKLEEARGPFPAPQI
jgi:Asp-tRNA(Asn)/Glu-tRNA(Gln) amidotransferase A subunit family amidase